MDPSLHTGGVAGSNSAAPTISSQNLAGQCAPLCSTEHEHAPECVEKLGEPVHAPSTPSPAPGWRLTEADTKGWHLREEAHHNGGEAFFAYSHRCIEQPRLVRYDRYERKGRSVTSTWRVDGVDHPSLASAVEALNTPPVFDVEEIAYLATLPTEWTKKTVPNNINWVVNQRVRDKGGVEWRDRHYRITPVGLAALSPTTKAGE